MAWTEANIEQQTATEACRAWPKVSYDSKNDTGLTVKSARANNKAHKAYCVGLGESK